MQPVLEPQPRVLGDGIGLEVHHQHTADRGLAADDRVELAHPLPQARAQRVDGRRVGHGEGQHGASGAAGLAEDDHVVGPDGVEVAARRRSRRSSRRRRSAGPAAWPARRPAGRCGSRASAGPGWPGWRTPAPRPDRRRCAGPAGRPSRGSRRRGRGPPGPRWWSRRSRRSAETSSQIHSYGTSPGRPAGAVATGPDARAMGRGPRSRTFNLLRGLYSRFAAAAEAAEWVWGGAQSTRSRDLGTMVGTGRLGCTPNPGGMPRSPLPIQGTR